MGQNSNGEVFLRADRVDGDTLHEQGVHVIAGGDTLQVAFTEAVLLITCEAACGFLDVVHTLPEAQRERAYLELCIKAGLVLVQVLFLVFVVELILQVEELAPRTEELVARVIIRRISHGVLGVADEGFNLLSVILTAISLSSHVHFPAF